MKPLNIVYEVLWRAFCACAWFAALTFCVTVDEDSGDDVPLRKFPEKKYLWEVFSRWFKDRLIVIVKSRQIFMSWALLFLHLWFAMTKKYRNVFIQAQKLEGPSGSVELLDRIRGIYNRFPMWIKVRCPVVRDINDPPQIVFGNGSRIFAIPGGINQHRGITISAIMLDEFAFQDFAEGTLNSSLAGIGRRGKLTVVSSANMSFMYSLIEDISNAFGVLKHKVMKGFTTWKNSLDEFDYRVLEIKFMADPEKDPDTEEGAAWYKQERAKYKSQQVWEREMLCNWFAHDGKRYFDTFDDQVNFKDLAIDPTLPVDFSWDYGFHCPAFIMTQTDNKNIVEGVPHHSVIHVQKGKDISLENFVPKFFFPIYKELKEKGIRMRHACDDHGTQVNPLSNKTAIETMQSFQDEDGEYMIRGMMWRRMGDKPSWDMVRRVIDAGQLDLNKDDLGCEDMRQGFMGGFTFKKFKPGISKEESELPQEGSTFMDIMDCLKYSIREFVLFKKRVIVPRKMVTMDFSGIGTNFHEIGLDYEESTGRISKYAGREETHGLVC